MKHSISPSNYYSGLSSFRIDWYDLLAVQGTLKRILQHHSSKASILRCSAFFMVQLSHPYMTTGKTIGLTRWTFVGKVREVRGHWSSCTSDTSHVWLLWVIHAAPSTVLSTCELYKGSLVLALFLRDFNCKIINLLLCFYGLLKFEQELTTVSQEINILAVVFFLLIFLWVSSRI